MRLRSVLPIGLVAMSALALAAQAMNLKWTPKAGDKATYKITGTFELGGAGEITLSGTRNEEIKSVDADKIVSTGTTKMTVNAMGNEVPVPEQTETTTQKSDGSVVEVKVGDVAQTGGAMRLARITMLKYPEKAVAVGDTWNSEGAKDEKADLPGYKVEYKLVGDEKVGAVDAWKITAKGTETEGAMPTKVESTFWVDKANGSMVRTLSQLTDAVFNDQVPPLSGKMDVVRQP